jgi:4-hydroxy-tetrahydrodipicolinate reductase
MKLILSGYGKMGREIEKIALERNHQIVAIIDNASDWELLIKNKTHADVVIDFSMPSVVIDNIKRSFSINIPIVTGTTGWHDQIENIIQLCKSQKQTLFFSSNFSIGVNIFFEVNKKLAQLMNTQEQYEVAIEESHHLQKLDSPSGTAITLANDIIKNLNRKKNWINADEKKDASICISSVRAENIVGIHKVSYDSPIDTIEIRHAAKNRRGLALGAVIAAEWVAGKKGVFEMKDLLNF